MKWLAIATVLAACGEPATRPVPISNRTSSELRPRPEDKGAIQGVVADAKTGEVLAGVTVIAVSPTASHTETAITDEHGAYKMTLGPGDWVVTFYYGDTTAERRVHVGLDKVTPVFMRLHSN